jgi:hypothetical protein
MDEEYIQLEIERLRAAVVAFNASFPRRWLCKHGAISCCGVKHRTYKELARQYREKKQLALDLLRS